MDTFEEMRGKILSQLDIIELIEILHITAEDIVDRFEDRVMMHADEIEEWIDE